MVKKEDYNLRLVHLVFDEISFKRLGFKNENQFESKLRITIGVNKEKSNGTSTLILTGEKKDEYNLKVSLTGIFSFGESVPQEIKKTLLEKNAVAILMPYLRSQVSLLTSQPETETFVLPVINVSSLIDQKSE